MDSNSLDLQTRILNAAVDHWPLVVGAVIGGWWGFPLMFKKTLSNGGGEIIRAIIRTENEVQSRLNQEETRRVVDHAIKAHESIEAERERAAHADLIQEITDRFQLTPRRNRRAR